MMTAIKLCGPRDEGDRWLIGGKRTLRIYFLQQRYEVLDKDLEDVSYVGIAMHAFAGINLAAGDIQDATTPLTFRRLSAKHDLMR
ncbi:hypothetical protein WK99_10395 [Burkholderia ubonensis]|nr:hypothetical protein WK99_10395 [Burkholderia ubonensis]